MNFYLTKNKTTAVYKYNKNLSNNFFGINYLGLGLYLNYTVPHKFLLYDKKYSFIRNYNINYSISLLLKKKKNINVSEQRKNTNYLNYFVGLACKKGFKLKTSRMLKKSFKLFYELFLFNKIADEFSNKYYYFKVLKNYAISWNNFFGVNFFLNLFLPFFESIFLLKCIKVEKTKRKAKNKPKFKLHVIYLTKKKRIHAAVKLIFSTIAFHERFNFSERFFCVLFDTFLFMDKSKVYRLKYLTYKKIMITRKAKSVDIT